MKKTLKITIIIFILLVLFKGISLLFETIEKYDIQNIEETYQKNCDFFKQLDFIVCINSQNGGPRHIDEDAWTSTSVKVQENGECYKMVTTYWGKYHTYTADIYKSKLADMELEELRTLLENTKFELISIESNKFVPDMATNSLKVNWQEKEYVFSIYGGENSDLDKIYSYVSKIKIEKMINYQ